ncbi:site-specific recombinase resolvase [Aromatoleum evansii]|uniref:Site-specific recombinase resolvase n=1 Tax=Aromatoleum evansii TaxID=59406 RepID=A0ABZ1AGB9_AROEV|nr:site-specific recombinase resolvase [Aromatoleum evansii]
MNRTRKKLVPAGQPFDRRHPLEAGEVRVTTFVPLTFKKRGIQKVVVAPAGVDAPVKIGTLMPAIPPNHDPTLLKALARGFYWQKLLDGGTVTSAAEIAEREGLHRVTVNDALRFTLLAPDIVAAILEGCLAPTFTLEALQRNTVPLDWYRQHEMISASR